MAGHSDSGDGSGGVSPAGRIAREVSALQASLLASLREELGADKPGQFAEAAERLAADFGSVTATAVDAASRGAGRGGSRSRRRCGGRRSWPRSTASWPASTSPATCAGGSTRWPRPTAATATPSRSPSSTPPARGRATATWRRPGDGAGDPRRGAARQHPHRRRSLPARGGRDLRARPEPADRRSGADGGAAAGPAGGAGAGGGAADRGLGRRRRLPRPRRPTSKRSCTRPTRRCGAPAPSGSRWASALCKIADRFRKFVHN